MHMFSRLRFPSTFLESLSTVGVVKSDRVGRVVITGRQEVDTEFDGKTSEKRKPEDLD